LLPARQALWSAARQLTGCRFDPASLLAASPAQAPRTGQQAGLAEREKAAASYRTPERFVHLHAQLLKAPGICTHNESLKIFASAEENQTLAISGENA
jgi:hypothetical protein